MEFGTYAGRAVLTAVDLVNSYDAVHDVERLAGAEGLVALLTDRGWVVDAPINERQLGRFRALRGRLRAAFEAPEVADVVAGLNQVLAEQRAVPQLTDHDGGWHWHYQPPGSALPDRVATTCAAALLGVIARDGDASRLRTCTADGCGNAFVDASRNGKRRFCDDRTCGNRTHAAAYRARQRPH
ncbi:CGNR zinc finger domain-containing protein [Flindersiella endophytica]